MKKIMLIFLLLGAGIHLTLATGKKNAELPEGTKLKLPALFADNMVLQQQAEDAVWGWAVPGQKIEVKGSWNHQAIEYTRADEKGYWKVHLKTPQAGGPYQLTIIGKDTLVLHNVMMGEVWICSGQSNMEMPVQGWDGASILHSEKEIKEADFSNIRLFKVERKIAFQPQEDCTGSWTECRPETVSDFSATAYFFGKQLYEKLKVPIGLIETCWGGTVAEAWTSRSALDELGDFEGLLDKVDSVKPHIAEMEQKQKQYEKAWEEHKDEIKEAYKEVDFQDDEWKEMQLPGYWEKAGYPDLDGNIWYRKNIQIPQHWKGKKLILDVGPVDDNDITWFNGYKVGATQGWQVKRSYEIPANIVHTGKNVIAIRITDVLGGGGIYGDKKDFSLYPADQTPEQGISLAGNWKFKIGLRKRTVQKIENPNLPTVLYNGMINPLLPFGIRGAIWYQGEANVGRASQYNNLFPAMIRNWRKNWGEGNFPFYFVQIAPYPYGGSGMEAAALRDAQRKTLRVPNTGMVVTLDIGDTTNIHPANKEEVGRRLSLWALNKTYGRKNIVFSGPLYKKMKVKGHQAILSFQYAEKGLIAKGGKLTSFEIAGKNGHFVPARAKVKGKQVIVTAKKVAHPVAVRYGWRDTAVPHLFNKAGLPASSFNTKN